MKKLLYIDPFSVYGHINLNQVFVRKLTEIGLEVQLAVREGYHLDLGLPREMLRLAIPERFFRDGLGRLASRYYLWKTLRHVKATIDLQEYDYVILSGYEEFSLFLSGIRRKLYLVNHGNVSGLQYPVKRCLIRRLSRHCTHIVFAPYLKERFAHFGITDVHVEGLGLSEPYAVAGRRRPDILRSISGRLSGDYRDIFFSPSGSKYGSTFVGDLVADPGFQAFIERNNILFVVRDASLHSAGGNIVIVRDLLTREQYQALFTASRLICISYPESFDYRVSASLFECFSNQKACLLSDIKAFRIFESHFNYDPFFKDIPTLINRLERFLLTSGTDGRLPFKNLESLNPTFSDLADSGT